MNSRILVIVVSSFAFVTSSLVACSSSDDGTAQPGPKNPGTPNGNEDSGAPNGNKDSGSSDPGVDAGDPNACTGATFDNTRIPGWPNVPQP